MDGKHHRSPFPKSDGRRATQLLEIVHSDICGKIEAKSLSGAEYFVTFIYDIINKRVVARQQMRGIDLISFIFK